MSAKTNTKRSFAKSEHMGEIAGSVQTSYETLRMLAELTDRGESGDSLHLSFDAATGLSRLLYQHAQELAVISDTLADG